jgi:hypothetical protein
MPWSAMSQWCCAMTAPIGAAFVDLDTRDALDSITA